MNPLIIKLGGVLLDSEEALERLFTALVNYRESHQRPLVIVHGGGCVVDELMKGLNLPVKKKNGLRVTPADQIDIITGALAGTANKTLLAWAKSWRTTHLICIRCPPARDGWLRESGPRAAVPDGAIALSAVSGEGLDALRQRLNQSFFQTADFMRNR